MKVSVIWPAGLAGLLALAALSALLMPAPAVEVDPPAPAGLARAAAPPALTAMAQGAWQDSILARPLFRPDRKPLAAAPQVSAAMPRLTAIVTTATGGSAIFAGDDGKPVIVTVGSDLNGFKVLAIGPDNVVLTGPSGRTMLQLTFANASDAATTSSPGTITLTPRHFLDNQ